VVFLAPLKIVGGSLFAFDVNGNDFAFRDEQVCGAVQSRTNEQHSAAARAADWNVRSTVRHRSLVSRHCIPAMPTSTKNGSCRCGYDGDLEIVAGTVLIPAFPPGHDPIRLHAPFTISGTLIVFKSDPSASPPPSPWFHHKVDGAGHVTVRLNAPIGSARTVTSYFYRLT
jgi:hypothetical protein